MEKGILTAIDANLNRTLEGLRVCEDIFRFNIRNRISEELKSIRHRLSALASFIPADELLASRDVEADTQKFIDTPGELRRESLLDIFRSNIRRAAEALRALEEFSKLADPSVSGGFQQTRFDIYDIEKRGAAIIGKQGILERFRNSLYAIIDSSIIPCDRIIDTAEILAEAGADIIQLRIKNLPDRIFFELACAVAEICRKKGVLFIVNDRADIAKLVKSDGVHIGQDDIPVERISEISGPGLIKGVSVSSIDEADKAIISSADYIAVGPVYPTSSKSGIKMEGIGFELLGTVCSQTDKPVVAIGGINTGNINHIFDAGCSCVAMISGLYNNGSVKENTLRIKELIRMR